MFHLRCTRHRAPGTLQDLWHLLTVVFFAKWASGVIEGIRHMSVAGKWLDCQTVSIDQLTSKWGETPHRDPRTQHVVHLVPSAAVLLCTFSSSWMELSSVTKHRWIPHHFLWPEALSLLLLHSVVCGKFRSPWSNFDQASLGPWTLHGPRNLRQPQSVLRCGSVVHIIMERVLALLLRVVGVRYLSWVLSYPKISIGDSIKNTNNILSESFHRVVYPHKCKGEILHGRANRNKQKAVSSWIERCIISGISSLPKWIIFI